MEDDPLLELLLAAPGAIDHAEERRLMYVAMTRARRETYLVTSKSRVSCFVEELAGSGYAGLVETIGMGALDLRCPVCDGRLVLKEGRHGPFWACSNFPLCDGRCRTCSACGAWPVLPADIERSIEPVPVAAGAAGDVGSVEPGRVGGFHCAGADCGAVFERCPECGVGVVLEIDGPYGKFWGCSEYRREGPSCEYKPRTG